MTLYSSLVFTHARGNQTNLYLVAFELFNGAGKQSVSSHCHSDVGHLFRESRYIYVLATSYKVESSVKQEREKSAKQGYSHY